ncbi:hypothetical protein [Lysinibacillus sp. 38-6]|uniref:hypothetical protein n=1 Tax=Lysinibacillus sp. 38-6 TaxID=3385991 RepID=UPI003908A9D1
MTRDDLKMIQKHTITAAFSTALGFADGETIAALQEDLTALNQMVETSETVTARNLVSSAIMFHVTGDAVHLRNAADYRDKVADFLLVGGTN